MSRFGSRIAKGRCDRLWIKQRVLHFPSRRKGGCDDPHFDLVRSFFDTFNWQSWMQSVRRLLQKRNWVFRYFDLNALSETNCKPRVTMFGTKRPELTLTRRTAVREHVSLSRCLSFFTTLSRREVFVTPRSTALRQVSFWILGQRLLSPVLSLRRERSTFAVFHRVCRWAGHLREYYLHGFINFNRTFVVVGVFTISERRTLGENISTYWLQNIYGRRTAEGEPRALGDSFRLSTAPLRLESSFRAAARLSYRLLP